MKGTAGEIDRLLEFAVPEVYSILELAALDFHSNSDPVVPQVERAGHTLIL